MWQRSGDYYYQATVVGDVGKDGRLRCVWGEGEWNRIKAEDLYDSEMEVIEAILERIDKQIGRHAERFEQIQGGEEHLDLANALRGLGDMLAEREGVKRPGKPMWLAEWNGNYRRVYVVGSARKDGKTPVVEYGNGPIRLVWTDNLFVQEADALALIRERTLSGGEALVRHRNKLIERLYVLKNPSAPTPLTLPEGSE